MRVEPIGCKIIEKLSSIYFEILYDYLEQYNNELSEEILEILDNYMYKVGSCIEDDPITLGSPTVMVRIFKNPKISVLDETIEIARDINDGDLEDALERFKLAYIEFLNSECNEGLYIITPE